MLNKNYKEFAYIDLFAGIGGMRLPFQELGGKCLFSSEWNEAAQETYFHNFGHRPEGDITKISECEIPDHNILLAGFPCQPFSILGDKKGFADTRGTLFFDIERILQAKTPGAFLLENVKMLTTHDRGKTFSVILDRLQCLGYTVYWKVLNALDYGLPQKRERIFIVGFRKPVKFHWPNNVGSYVPLDEILERDDEVDPSLFASERIREDRLLKCKIKPFYPSIWHQNKSGNISILPYSCALRAGASHNYLLVNGIRRPSSRELLRLQGFPEEFKIVVSHSQLRKQMGNSVSVPVVRRIAMNILESLKEDSRVSQAELQGELFTLEEAI